MARPFYNLPAIGPGRLSPRNRVLAQWRGVDLTALEKARRLQVRPTGELLPHLLNELRIDKRMSDVEILKVWNQLLDPVITAHAQPTGLRNGTLFVSVDSSPWLSEIVRYRRREILERLQHSFGPDLICRISFRVG